MRMGLAPLVACRRTCDPGCHDLEKVTVCSVYAGVTLDALRIRCEEMAIAVLETVSERISGRVRSLYPSSGLVCGSLACRVSLAIDHGLCLGPS